MVEKTRKWQTISLEEVVAACQSESRQSRNDEEGYCLELFHRALQDADDEAWTAVEQQYRLLVCHWLWASAPEGMSQTEVNMLAGDVFAKFWRTLSRQSVNVVDKFPHVGALLRYLQQCALSVLRDAQQARLRQVRLQERLIALNTTDISYEIEDTVSDTLEQKRRLDRVHGWIRSKVTDEEEKLILSLLFEQDLSPAQVAERLPQQFDSPLVVRRIRDKILKRARRALIFD